MNASFRTVFFGVTLLTLPGCADSPPAAAPSGAAAVEHVASDVERAQAHAKQPINADSALLYVNGLGCPLCATNLDLQLVSVKGVRKVTVDLGNGTARVEFEPTGRPSPDRLSRAIDEAGLKLVKIESPAPGNGGVR